MAIDSSKKAASSKPLDEDAIQTAAEAEMDRYCAEHPRSPSAQRRPRLLRRGDIWVALLGNSMEDGVSGLGGTVEAALRAFDVHYRNSLRPRE
ncbi:MAG: hypothetical protein ABI992_08310 [Chthoniobacterales bacterium]